MMRYALCNIYLTNDEYLDQIMTNDILKSLPYNAKIKNKKTKQSSFLYVLIPLDNLTDPIETSEVIKFMQSHASIGFIDAGNELEMQKYASLYNTFLNIKENHFTFDVITELSEKDFDIFYTDGSSSPKKSEASWGCTKLINESYEEGSQIDILTNLSYTYEPYSGIVQNGTNNIGELTAVSKAIELQGEKQFQVIISDSEYSIKSFREWIHNWKKNNYKSSAKKTIENCELIQNIQSLIEKSDKVFLFKWAKGHDGIPFNEICDRLAKDELGIE